MLLRSRLLITGCKNVGLVLLATVLALALMEALLRMAPSLVPATVRVNPPVRRVHAFERETYDVKLSDGDLWHWLRGNIQPMQPTHDCVVARVHYVTDAYGFPNPPSGESRYTIVALGDSFTEGRMVAVPWPRRLAESTGLGVLNLAQSAFGPQEELEVLQRYGVDNQPELVVMAYFEGNDLHDVAAFEQAFPLILFRLGKYVLNGITASSKTETPDGSSGPMARTSRALPWTGVTYQYPIAVTIGDSTLEMAFFPNYIAWLSAERQAIESSRNYRLATEIIVQMQELSERMGSRFLVMYIPSKARVYLRQLSAAVLARVLRNVHSTELNEAGYLEFTSRPVSAEHILQHMDDQAAALTDFAAEHDIAFIDLTPHLQREAAMGLELYYPFDTHWNQRAHDLAAHVIGEYTPGPSMGKWKNAAK